MELIYVDKNTESIIGIISITDLFAKYYI